MIHKKSLIIACMFMLMFSLNNSIFLKNSDCPQPVKPSSEPTPPVMVSATGSLKSTPASDQVTEAKSESNAGDDYKESLLNLQNVLSDAVKQLNERQAKEEAKMAKQGEEIKKQESVVGTSAGAVLVKPTITANANTNASCEVQQKALIQFDGKESVEDFGKFLNLKVAPPTIANSISNTESVAKSAATDNSVSNTLQNVKSNTNADATGDKNSIAVSNVVSNTEAISNNVADDNSKTVTAVQNNNTGNSTAAASENSLAVSSVKNDQKSETNTIAKDNSNAVGAASLNTEAVSAANATQGSIADTKAIADEKTVTNTAACNNSTAIGVTTLDTSANSAAEASNQSLAQSVAESKNTGATNTVAKDSSAAVGVTNITSNSNSTANASDGGNALSISQAKSNVCTDSIASNASASIVANNGGSNSVASSVSKGIAEPYINPLESASHRDRGPPSLQTSAPAKDDCGVKIPSILDSTSKVTVKSRETRDLMDKVMDEKSKCGTLEENKQDVLKAIGGKTQDDKASNEDKKVSTCGEDEASRNREREERNKLREENKKLKKLREESEDSDRAAKKAEKKRQRRSRKNKHRSRKSRGSSDRQTDMSAPSIQAGSEICGDNAKISKKLQDDFDKGIKDANVKDDERFSEANMYRDKILDYDKRFNDQKVTDDCQKICCDEKLGDFLESEIQDILKGRFLFKCKCQKGTTDWYMYDDKTSKSNALSSSSGLLLKSEPGYDEDRKEFDCAVEATKAAKQPEPAATNVTLQGTTPSASSNVPDTVEASRPERAPESTPASDCETAQEYEDLDDDDKESECGKFVSDRISAAKNKHGGCDKMHTNLGDCFNHFIENKFDKLHRRLNRIKSRNTNYIKDLQKKQVRKQQAKVDDIVDKSADGIDSEVSPGICNPLKGGENLRSIQTNLNDLKRDLNINRVAICSPEDKYFQSRNVKDQERFNDRLQSRFGEKGRCVENRFANRFDNTDRFGSKDDECMNKANLKDNSNNFISEQVGRIKDQNQDYLGKIKSMFGGCGDN